jgi:hypothetical protein
MQPGSDSVAGIWVDQHLGWLVGVARIAGDHCDDGVGQPAIVAVIL